jgi:hypothetical protein
VATSVEVEKGGEEGEQGGKSPFVILSVVACGVTVCSQKERRQQWLCVVLILDPELLAGSRTKAELRG